MFFRTDILQWGLYGAGAAATVTAAAALIVVPALAQRGMWSAGFMYLLMLVLFHLSIPIVLATGGRLPKEFADYTATWYRSGHVPEAIYLSGMAVVALTTAYAWTHLRGRPEPAASPVVVAPKRFAQIGACLVVGGVVLYLGNVAVTAPQLLIGGTYRDYLGTAGGTQVIAAATMMLAVGLCLAVVSGPCRERTIAWVAFGLFAAITLSFGGRTAAMFPAVAAVVAAAASAGRTPRARTALLIVFLGLMSITAVEQVRSTGLSASSVSAVSLNPVAAMAETGATIRTVAEVVRWRRTYREPQYNGSTYITSAQRLWERIMGKERPVVRDDRYAGELLDRRFPALKLGFSPIAEAFLNFGTAGVVVLFLIFGLVLGVFDSMRLGCIGAARLGVVMYALAYGVRNASNVLPTTIAIGLLVIWWASRSTKGDPGLLADADLPRGAGGVDSPAGGVGQPDGDRVGG